MKSLCSKFTLVTSRPGLFLDRDGVLIEDKGYVNSKKDTSFIASSFEAISLARASGFLIFVITNQAGIAKGYYTEEECLQFNKWLMEEFASKNASIDELVYCPSHPDFGDRISCNCRKPGTGMLESLANKWNIDLTNSLLLGDKDSDVLAGHNFRISSELISPSSDLVEIVKNHILFAKETSKVRKVSAIG